MNFFAIVSLGVYPTPTPSDLGRAQYAVSWGLWGPGYPYSGGYLGKGAYTSMGFAFTMGQEK